MRQAPDRCFSHAQHDSGRSVMRSVHRLMWQTDGSWPEIRKTVVTSALACQWREGGPQPGGRAGKLAWETARHIGTRSCAYNRTNEVTSNAGAAWPLPILSDTTLHSEHSCASCALVCTCVRAVETSDTNARAVTNANSASQALPRRGRSKGASVVELIGCMVVGSGCCVKEVLNVLRLAVLVKIAATNRAER